MTRVVGLAMLVVGCGWLAWKPEVLAELLSALFPTEHRWDGVSTHQRRMRALKKVSRHG